MMPKVGWTAPSTSKEKTTTTSFCPCPPWWTTYSERHDSITTVRERLYINGGPNFVFVVYCTSSSVRLLSLSGTSTVSVSTAILIVLAISAAIGALLFAGYGFLFVDGE